MTNNCPPDYMSAPVVQPYEYGLFSVINRVGTPPRHWRCGVQWEPLNCTPARGYPIDQCPPPEELDPKSVDDSVPLFDADPFVVYDGYFCRLPGRSDESEIMRRAAESLALGEQRRVEEIFWTGSAGNDPFLASPSAVVVNAVPAPTAADALKLPAAIGALEECAGARFAGGAVLHAPRGVAAPMASHTLLQRQGSRLTTWLGNPIAFYGGSPNTGPDGTPAPPGTAWIYITSPVFAISGEIVVRPDSIAQALNRVDNEVFVLAEREWLLGFDCLHCAVLADISC